MAVIELGSVTALFSNSGDLELRGDLDAMRRIAELMAGAAGSRARAALGRPKHGPKPYDGFLASLEIEILKKNGSGVQIARRGDALVISGIANMMEILADNVRLLAEQLEQSGEEEGHVHIEYHPDHYFLAESSEPLVLVATKRQVGAGAGR